MFMNLYLSVLIVIVFYFPPASRQPWRDTAFNKTI